MFSLRLPLFGLLPSKSPLDGLIDHYQKIHGAVDYIHESLECYLGGGTCREFHELVEQIDRLENEADKIKRSIRNRIPRRLFMPVDKTLFLNYTRSQDNILDAAQEGLFWLSMRAVEVPEEHQRSMVLFLDDVMATVTLLGPALEATIKLIYAQELDRDAVKNKLRAVRRQREQVFKSKGPLISAIYNQDRDFKDIYQLIHFILQMDGMSHNSGNCAELLRAMIAR